MGLCTFCRNNNLISSSCASELILLEFELHILSLLVTGLNYVFQAGTKLFSILLPHPKCAGIKVTSQHAQPLAFPWDHYVYTVENLVEGSLNYSALILLPFLLSTPPFKLFKYLCFFLHIKLCVLCEAIKYLIIKIFYLCINTLLAFSVTRSYYVL